MRYLWLIGILLCGALLAHPTSASAQDNNGSDERVNNAMAYGVVTMEYATGGLLYAFLKRGRLPPPWLHVTLSLTPWALGTGVGIISYRGRWNGDVARSAHGVMWAGLDGFLIGGMLDGYLRRDGFHAGQWAYTMGITGAVLGAWVGAAKVDAGRETGIWLGAPPAAAGVSFVVGGVAALILSLRGKDRAAIRVLGISAAAAVTTGLLLGSLGSSTEQSQSAAPGDQPAGPQRFMISVPFTF